MDSQDYENVPLRIQSIYDTCPPEEQQYLIRILEELSETGVSPTYDTLWLQDYKELPVDLDTFLCDERYLGATTDNGNAIYPYWKSAMHDVFDAGNKYVQVVFTGATRIGKTSTAITCAAYMLYRMMCLRDPQKFFQKKEVSQFSLLFFNLTLDLARSVAYREFNDTLKLSKWFNQHGTFSKSERNFYYIPEGGKIVVEAGSDVSHSLGKQVFCLVGTTEVYTTTGTYTLEQLASIQRKSRWKTFYSSDGRTIMPEDRPSAVVETKRVKHTYKVYVDDTHYVEGTPEHELMLLDGSYVRMDDIDEGDILFGICDDGDRNIKVVKVTEAFYTTSVPVYDVIDCRLNHNFTVKLGDTYIVAHNCAVLDEVNFAKSGVKDVNKAKGRIKEIFDSVVARVEGTFRQQGEVYGKIFAVSSKKTDSDFMEDHVQQQLSAGNEHLISFDKPQWEVLPEDQFSPERFYIAVGDRHRKGFVVTDDSDDALDELRDQGYQLMKVPIDMKSNFIADFDISLRDLAGIAVPGAMSFITQEVIDQCIGNRRSPFYQEILEIGTKDRYCIEEFFHMEVIDKSLLHCPMFIDVDLSLNDDKTGISGVSLTCRKDIENDEGKIVSLPSFTHVFSVAIKAPTGDKIPYSKITAFILWLRKQHFNISRCSRDQYQSEYMGQLLEAQGFTVDKLSVDRTADGYMAFRDVLMDQRIDLLDHQLLQDELIHLQRDGLSGVPDHPLGMSKDCADSLARATWNAIKNNSGIEVPRKSVAKAIQTINNPGRKKVVTKSDNLENLFPNLYPNSRRR